MSGELRDDLRQRTARRGTRQRAGCNDGSVNQAQRHAVIVSLVALATSDDYRDRADAGPALANFAQAEESREILHRLVLDTDDTFVTLVTTEALLRRQDTVGISIVADALVTADFQRLTYIHDAIRTVFGIFAYERDQAVEACDALVASEGNARVREGAAHLREALAAIDPVLYPEQRD
jgi:hypothetical protein